MSQQTQPNLVLVDGSSYFFRAYHALPPLTNKHGQPTGAIYGVANMIRKLINDEAPSHIAVVFDAKGKTFRDELYADYKANRDKMPDDLACQFKPLVELIEAMGLPILLVDGVEADDVIGTLARRAEQQQMQTLISTGDKDMAQLVNDNIMLINTMTNNRMDREGVIDKFGVPPEGIIDYLTLIGDKVDNVPGVDKVGPKTAVKWLSQYGSLDNLMANADEIGGKVGENLRQALPDLPLSKKLVTIKDDVELELQPSDLVAMPTDKAKLIELCRQLEFKRWLDDLLQEAEEPVASNYQLITSQEDWQALLQQLKKVDCFAFDTETTSLITHQAELVGISLAWADNAVYIPVGHDYPGVPEQLSREQVLADLKPILAAENIKKVGQNLKYDINVLANYGITINGIAFDTMLGSYVLNSSASRHDLDSLALKYLGRGTIHFEDIAGKGSKQLRFDQITIEQAAPYAAEDAEVAWQLYVYLKQQLAKHNKLSHVLSDIELPLMPILAKMERHGVLIDADKLTKQSKQLSKRIAELEQQAHELAGETFNLASPKQLQKILFEQLKLPVLQKTPKGAPSTAESVLHELAHDYPLPAVILEYRSLSKLKSTYTDSLPRQILAKTHRVHTSYNQSVAATGRLSSTDPNLQNIPVRNEQGRKIRQAFIAPEGKKIVAADYSQIELRIMAHLTDDPGLMTAFKQGLDIHRATASEVFNVAFDKVSADQRRHAKAVNFGLIYGMSAFGLAKQLEISREDAQQYIDTYFKRYPNVHDYMESTRKLAHEQGYVETLSGRRLYLPDINTRNMARQRAAERAAINAPLQGSAADIIKLAMIEVDQWLSQGKLDAVMIMQVHDELVFEVAEQDCKSFCEQLPEKMANGMSLGVPLEVVIGIGDNWDQAH